jgi:hypothetical protein
MKNLLILSLIISSFSIMSCSTGTHDSHDHASNETTWQTMTFTQDAPSFRDVSDGDDKREHGEMLIFGATLRDTTGQVAARLIGMMTIVDVPGIESFNNTAIEERFTHMAIIFPDGDEISISGANIYPFDSRIMEVNVPQQRAIIGGTGKFKGIRGQLTTTRYEDLTYSQVLEYRLD